MKKWYVLFFISCLLFSQSAISASKISLKGSLNNNQSVRTLVDPIIVMQNQNALNVQVSINNNLKIEIVDGNGFLIYEKELTNYRGQELVIPISDWSIGNYEISIINKDIEKSATGIFLLD